MSTTTMSMFSTLFVRTKSPKKVQASAQTHKSERSVLIDKLCDSYGTRYSDLAKYRALLQNRTL
jgi:hypothetical protein